MPELHRRNSLDARLRAAAAKRDSSEAEGAEEQSVRPAQHEPNSSSPQPAPNLFSSEYAGGKLIVSLEAAPGQPGHARGAYAVHVENVRSDCPVEVWLDCSSSTNVVFERTILGQTVAGGHEAYVSIAPGERVAAPRLVQGSISRAYKINYQVRWQFGPPDPTLQARRQKKELEQTLALLGDMQRLKVEMHARGLDPFDPALLSQELERRRMHYVDIGFAPVPSSIAHAPAVAARYSWTRPSAFVRGELHVFEGGLHPNDVRQGELGNCWLLCGVAALAEFPRLVHALFAYRWRDEHTGWSASGRHLLSRASRSEAGLYELRMHKHGQARAVIIDDHVPCKPGGAAPEPAFSRNYGNELWVLLVEKAFAKLHGSYYAMRFGYCNEALLDLTGAPTLSLSLADDGVSFADLLCWDHNNCLVCASVPGIDTLTERSGGGDALAAAPSGLVPGHTYSVIDAVRLQHGRHAGAEILRIRNPWGRFEWRGAWSDHSAELRDATVREELAALSQTEQHEAAGDDGLFWMSFADFKAHFVSVSVCMVHLPQPGSSLLVHPPAPRAPPPTKVEVATRWPAELRRTAKTCVGCAAGPGALVGRGAPGAVPLRPLHAFALTAAAPRGEKALVQLMAHQFDDRVPAAPAHLDVALAVFRVGGGGGGGAAPALVLDARCAHGMRWTGERDAFLELLLEPGEYLVAPITSGLRPKTPPPVIPLGGDPLRPTEHGLNSSVKVGAFNQICFALDADMDGRLGAADLAQRAAAPFVAAAAIDLSPAGAPSPPGSSFKLADYPRGVGKKLLIYLVGEAWRGLPDERQRWQRLFEATGFDKRTLQPRHVHHPLVLSTHAFPSACELRAVELAPELHDWALCALVRAEGKRTQLTPTATLYTFQAEAGVAFACENSHPSHGLRLSLDCSGSRNVRSDRADGALRAVVDVPPAAHGVPGAVAVLTLLPLNLRLDWKFAFTWKSAALQRGADAHAFDPAAAVRTALASASGVPLAVHPPSLDALPPASPRAKPKPRLWAVELPAHPEPAPAPQPKPLPPPTSLPSPRRAVAGSLFGSNGPPPAPPPPTPPRRRTDAPPAEPGEPDALDAAAARVQATQRGRRERRRLRRRSGGGGGGDRDSDGDAEADGSVPPAVEPPPPAAAEPSGKLSVVQAFYRRSDDTVDEDAAATRLQASARGRNERAAQRVRRRRRESAEPLEESAERGQGEAWLPEVAAAPASTGGSQLLVDTLSTMRFALGEAGRGMGCCARAMFGAGPRRVGKI